MQSTQPDHIILLAHGSRDPRWREPFESLLASLKGNPSTQNVSMAYMEMAKPRLLEVVEHVVEQGFTNIQILPLFMASGGHLRHDVPNQLSELKQQHPNVTWTLLPPVGEHPKVAGAIETIVGEAFQPWG